MAVQIFNYRLLSIFIFVFILSQHQSYGSINTYTTFEEHDDVNWRLLWDRLKSIVYRAPVIFGAMSVMAITIGIVAGIGSAIVGICTGLVITLIVIGIAVLGAFSALLAVGAALLGLVSAFLEILDSIPPAAEMRN